jgi:hypothetical protein
MTTTRSPIDRHTLLSLVWLFVLANFIYCDVIGLHDPSVLRSLFDGHAGDIQITPPFLLASSVLMEIPIAMVLVSRITSRRVARVASIVSASFMVLVQSSSLFVSVPSPSYAFFSTIEVGGLVAIIVLAARWRSHAAQTTERTAATLDL